jgi:radical SAM protein with 4Fe4S-binding SPASM domain
MNKRIDLVSSIPLKGPLTVHVELTNKCNFSCTYCPESLPNYGEIVGGFKFMSIQDFIRVADSLRRLGTLEVIRFWIMGEPLLNKDIYKIAAYSKEEKLAKRIEVTSNASVINSENAKSLVSSGIDVIKISIYGIGVKHNTITKSKLSSDRIMNSVRLLKTERDRCNSKLKIVTKYIDPDCQSEVDEFIRLYSPLSDECEVKAPHSWTFSSLTEVLNVNVQTIGAGTNQSKQVCAFPFYTLAIHVDGTVSVCCVDWNKKVTVGNIFSDDIYEIWNGERIKYIRESHINRKACDLEGCRDCHYYQDNCPENIDSYKLLKEFQS